MKASFQETQWDGIFAGLDAKRFDVVANQVSITAERKAKYEFSKPYTVCHRRDRHQADDDSIKCFDDLKGKTTAQSLTSNWYTLAAAERRERRGRRRLGAGDHLLKQGRVDATINDKLTYLDSKDRPATTASRSPPRPPTSR